MIFKNILAYVDVNYIKYFLNIYIKNSLMHVLILYYDIYVRHIINLVCIIRIIHDASHKHLFFNLLMILIIPYSPETLIDIYNLVVSQRIQYYLEL